MQVASVAVTFVVDVHIMSHFLPFSGSYILAPLLPQCVPEPLEEIRCLISDRILSNLVFAQPFDQL